MSEFMAMVERAVRPVVAGTKRKMRMREELLAHLDGVYQEELARSGDQAAARAEAVRRFGDPAALTAELQQSVSFRERLDGRLNRLFGWRPGEPGVLFAGRLAGLVAAIVAVWLALTLAATAVRRPHDGSVPSAAQLLQLFGALLVFAPAAVFLLTVLFLRIRGSLFVGGGSRRSWRRAIGFAAVSVLVVPAAGTAFYLTGLPEVSEVMSELTTARSLAFSVASYLMIPLVLLWFAWKTGPAAVRRAEWAALDIG